MLSSILFVVFFLSANVPKLNGSKDNILVADNADTSNTETSLLLLKYDNLNKKTSQSEKCRRDRKRIHMSCCCRKLCSTCYRRSKKHFRSEISTSDIESTRRTKKVKILRQRKSQKPMHEASLTQAEKQGEVSVLGDFVSVNPQGQAKTAKPLTERVPQKTMIKSNISEKTFGEKTTTTLKGILKMKNDGRNTQKTAEAKKDLTLPADNTKLDLSDDVIVTDSEDQNVMKDAGDKTLKDDKIFSGKASDKTIVPKYTTGKTQKGVTFAEKTHVFEKTNVEQDGEKTIRATKIASKTKEITSDADDLADITEVRDMLNENSKTSGRVNPRTALGEETT